MASASNRKGNSASAANKIETKVFLGGIYFEHPRYRPVPSDDGVLSDDYSEESATKPLEKGITGWAAFFPTRPELTGYGRCESKRKINLFQGIMNAENFALQQALEHNLSLVMYVPNTMMVRSGPMLEEFRDLSDKVEYRRVALNPETDPANHLYKGSVPHPGLWKAYELAKEGLKSNAVVYVDGSCLRNGLKDASAGIGVYWPHFRSLTTGRPLEGEVQKSGRAELKAAIIALEQANEAELHGKLTIHTDSTYVKNSVEKWIPGWKKNNWTRPDGSVANLDFIKRLDKLNQLVKPKWEWVPAHSKIRGNEMADKLANDGAKMQLELLTEKFKKL